MSGNSKQRRTFRRIVIAAVADLMSSDPQDPRQSRVGEVLTGLALDLVVAAVPAVTTIPVFWRWTMWLFCFIAFLCLLQILITPIWKVSLAVKIVCTFLAISIFVIGLYPVAYSQWREEKAAMLEGDLSAGVEHSDSPIILQIGDSIAKLKFTGPDQLRLKIAYDAGLRIWQGKHGLEVSTPIRDKARHLIAKIESNHWSVSPDHSVCFDKNYTSNSFEVKDGADHVVFQLRILPDRVQLQGEWRDEFGHGMRLAPCLTPRGPAGCITLWNNPEKERELEELIEPMFKYPSREHWGEFVKKRN